MPQSVQIHQSAYSSSGSSSSRGSSSYGGSPPRAVAPGVYREYGARNHSSYVSSSGSNTVVNHGQRSYDAMAPKPGYRSSSHH